MIQIKSRAKGSSADTWSPQPAGARNLAGGGRVLLFVDNNLGMFLWHRLALARAARDIGFVVHVAAPASPDSEVLTQHGFTFHPIPLARRSINPLREVQTILALRRLYRQIKPELIHHLRLKPVLYG